MPGNQACHYVEAIICNIEAVFHNQSVVDSAGKAFPSVKRNMLRGVTQRFLLRHDVHSHRGKVEWGGRTLQADSAVFVKHEKIGLDPFAILVL